MCKKILVLHLTIDCDEASFLHWSKGLCHGLEILKTLTLFSQVLLFVMHLNLCLWCLFYLTVTLKFPPIWISLLFFKSQRKWLKALWHKSFNIKIFPEKNHLRLRKKLSNHKQIHRVKEKRTSNKIINKMFAKTLMK